ncbi:uracil-DNA glycosylase [Paenalcaligenes faecalis]|uniref:uracil-DNA glycosylase n=1 Tax=Paenalcaligenes faecalis TaxID=2980099 RepID=UPI0022B9C44E|nr:uracil-DNA glycosylase [Paenalcaligenes faecalis]
MQMQQLGLLDQPETLNQLAGSLQPLVAALSPSWQQVLQQEPLQSKLQLLDHWLKQRLSAGAVIYPANPFYALTLSQPEDIKVVILGQDPYHGPGQAQGLAFSVPDYIARPPSLRNIYEELHLEYPEYANQPPQHDLSAWAKQGVLLLNTSLTVEDGKAASHANKGWEYISDGILRHILTLATPKVFMLWGNHAQAKQPLIDEYATAPVLSLHSNHPSPLSAKRKPTPFIGNGHFMQCNEWLEQHGEKPISWL